MSLRANFCLADYSTARTETLRSHLGLDFHAAAQGSMQVFVTQKAMARAASSARTLATLGLKADFLDAKEAIRLEPQLSEVNGRIAGAIYYPDDKTGDPFLFVRALAARAEKAGGTIRFNLAANRIVTEAGRVVGVSAGREILKADHVVLAAGTAAPQLAGEIGIRLPIAPVKGYSATIEMTEKAELPHVAIIDDATHTAVVPLGGRMRVVGSAEFAGFDMRIRAERIDDLWNTFECLYPRLASHADRQGLRQWAGLRAVSSDGRPYIGETHIKGLWINGGHGHLGWTMAAGSAALLSALMTGNAPDINPEPYRVHR